ncbi:MAG: hypothetical protein F6K28_43150 [Microcoleus sp. SIO2G3]|nr:hypothetical protein [Microcoleus sp. SIO2G3]
MNIEHKRLLASGTQRCLIIPLGGGIKVQHPVLDELDAIELYSHYSELHPHLRFQYQPELELVPSAQLT